ncbi:protein NRT1/ PTR FAMILY 4.3-like [Prosopis cineraria]|uniref:protein NRT1/ PTR FAMILY 4.3-like n=1 Tax=Prosopis cineraria TaxID=364024 RepID=UPI00240FC231|nr:protein NRT1/ PTR FAMILY 4.3-like [Prosopis cineraria]
MTLSSPMMIVIEYLPKVFRPQHQSAAIPSKILENPEQVDNGHKEKEALIVVDKVDWKGRGKALKHEHGGMNKTSFLILNTTQTTILPAGANTHFNGIMHFDVVELAKMLTNNKALALVTCLSPSPSSTILGLADSKLSSSLVALNFWFLDKADIKTRPTTEVDNSAPNPWKLCRVTQAKNAKLSSKPSAYNTIDSQISRSFKIPQASLPIIPVAFLIIVVPVYGHIIVPVLHKITGNPTGITHLQRIRVGLILSCIFMAISAVIEVKRKQIARDHSMLDAEPTRNPLPMTIFLLFFQYFVFGIADLFTYAGLLEIFYSESVNSATKNIKNSGRWLAGNNINRNHLNLFYLFLAVMSLINFYIYQITSSRYKNRPQVSEVEQGDSKY